MFKNILLLIVVALATNSGCSTKPSTPVTAESNILHTVEQAGDQMVSDWKQAERKTLMGREGPEIKTRAVRLPGFGLVTLPASWADPVQDNGVWICQGEDGKLSWATGPFVQGLAVDKGKGRFDWETSTTLFAVQMHGEKWIQLELSKIYYSKSWKKAWKEELSKFQD